MTEQLQATAVVEKMLWAMRDGDIDTALEYIDDAIVWHNVGMPKVRGIARFTKFMRALAKPGHGFDVMIHNIAADGDIVLTERTDVLVWRRLRVQFWVCGTFELRDGKILVWRDYFDNVDFFKGVVRGAFRALAR
ncbi:limonene-1,2-epoxide hydrolase family protein [Rhodococcoides yunnanense]|uniref:limonene-1,2-epoxide hydrolase family protein n=1 Tax=Rhodococcoides yunnanense TaxID=278209 RepID=UPI000A00189A|nr:limonene-1,2-epoxide hydrolase family protein [Rhodococcus yunnanensis]